MISDLAAQFGEGDLLDLADALLGEAQALAELLVGRGGAFIETEMAAKDVALARVEPTQQLRDFLAGVETLGSEGRVPVGDFESAVPRANAPARTPAAAMAVALIEVLTPVLRSITVLPR